MANYGSDIHSTRFINSCISCNLRPTISIPTRINKQSHTLLDNIFTNFMGKNQTGVIQNDITDHFSIFMGLKPNTAPNNKESMNIWNYNKNTINKNQKLINEMECLGNVNISTQLMYTTFNEKMSFAHNESFSRQGKKITYKNKLPWINETLRNMIRKKISCILSVHGWAYSIYPVLGPVHKQSQVNYNELELQFKSISSNFIA